MALAVSLARRAPRDHAGRPGSVQPVRRWICAVPSRHTVRGKEGCRAVVHALPRDGGCERKASRCGRLPCRFLVTLLAMAIGGREGRGMRQRNRGGLSAPVRWLPPSDLPASLVALIEMIFGETDWMVSHNRLARGLRKKPGTLKALGDHGALPYRLDGVRRVYAREDVAAFLGRRDASRAAGTMEVSSLTPTLSGGLANSST